MHACVWLAMRATASWRVACLEVPALRLCGCAGCHAQRAAARAQRTDLARRVALCGGTESHEGDGGGVYDVTNRSDCLAVRCADAFRPVFKLTTLQSLARRILCLITAYS